MRNCLLFASISHGAKNKFKRKRDTLVMGYSKRYFSYLFEGNWVVEAA
jgi:hypothetical protein